MDQASESNIGITELSSENEAKPSGSIEDVPPLNEGEDERQPHEADYGGEVFDVVNEQNEVIGTETRKKCHKEGILHRSTHVFLFRHHQPIGRSRPRMEVLLQKRSEKKKVASGHWDVSVAEHLSSGESYSTAAIRGLKEELGLSNVNEDDLLRIRNCYLSRQVFPEAGVLENMFTETFALLYDSRSHGHIDIDEEEVELVEWWDVRDLVVKGKADKQGNTFTNWLLIELRNLDLMEVGSMITGIM